MNQTYNETIVKLKKQVKELISYNEKTLEDKKALEEKNNKYNLELEHTRIRLRELEEENKRLQLAKSIVSREHGNGEAKQMVNSIVREIDKCIALLNK